MKLEQLAPADFRTRLHRGDLVLQAGVFRYRLQSPLPRIEQGLWQLYGGYPCLPPQSYADFPLQLDHGRGLHRWWRRQVRFSSDGERPFEPLPQSHAFAQMEWAMNWSVSMRAHQYLMLHAAVLERGGRALVMPAPPGSGKSTLCAALTHSDWRLMTDELCLVDLVDQRIHAAARPVSLKNNSLDVIRRYAPQAVFGAVTRGTTKGDVVHMRVPQAHVERMQESARPRLVVFPRYAAGEPTRLTPLPKAPAMIELGKNAFNYLVLGLQGFEVLGAMLERCDCYELRYSDLHDAIPRLSDLLDGLPEPEVAG